MYKSADVDSLVPAPGWWGSSVRPSVLQLSPPSLSPSVNGLRRVIRSLTPAPSRRNRGPGPQGVGGGGIPRDTSGPHTLAQKPNTHSSTWKLGDERGAKHNPSPNLLHPHRRCPGPPGLSLSLLETRWVAGALTSRTSTYPRGPRHKFRRSVTPSKGRRLGCPFPVPRRGPGTPRQDRLAYPRPSPVP